MAGFVLDRDAGQSFDTPPSVARCRKKQPDNDSLVVNGNLAWMVEYLFYRAIPNFKGGPTTCPWKYHATADFRLYPD
jgi:hypothetical protein